MKFRQFLQAFTCTALLVLCSSCGSGSSASAAETAKPLDLSGSWKEESAKPSDTYQVAYISDNQIEVYWIMENETQNSIYWSGSYAAPADSKTPYVWESENNKDKTANSLLASTDDRKTFTYENDAITYDVTVMGTTKTVKLVKSQEDYSALGGPVTNQSSTEQLEPVQLVDSGYTVITNGYDNSKYINYAVQIANPNKNYAIIFPIIHVTVKGTDGSILSAYDQTLGFVSAGESYYYAGMTASYQGDMPGSVEITADNGNDDYAAQDGSGYVLSSDLPISNTSDTSDATTGEIMNNSKTDISMAAVIVIYKMGDKLVGGDTTYINNLNSGSKSAFQISKFGGVSQDQYDSYIVNAIQWGY